MIEMKRTAVGLLSKITKIPLRLLTREILHKQTVLGVLELNADRSPPNAMPLTTEQMNVCLTLHCYLPGSNVE